MLDAQRRARITGGLYLLTVATSIPALALKSPVLDDANPVAAAASSDRLAWAASLEIILAVACVGTAVVLLPVLRHLNPSAATGFLSARTVEAGLIAVGVLAMLTLTDASMNTSSADVATGLHDWAFLLGPGFIPAVNAVLLGSILLRSRLVPRAIPLVGLIGAPLLAASATATVFGALDQVSPPAGALALPIALWEITLGIWLVTRGFSKDALRDRDAQGASGDTVSARAV